MKTSPRSPFAVFLLAVALLANTPARAQDPTPCPMCGMDEKADGKHEAKTTGGGSKLPPFFKVDSLYYLDGNEDDLVKVLETSDATGWIRVQTKVGESWVNVANLSSVTPVSKEAAAKLQLRAKADYILGGAGEIAEAINEYASKNNVPATAGFKWLDIRKFLKPDATVRDSGGKDVTGRPYHFGTKVEDGVKVDADTIKEVAPVIEDEGAYWGKFKP